MLKGKKFKDFVKKIPCQVMDFFFKGITRGDHLGASRDEKKYFV